MWKLIADLRLLWPGIGSIERGERLRTLAEAGCSTRVLGEALGHSATSIRRHIKLATLPAKDREAIEAGASAKKILAQKASDDRRRCSQRRVSEDRKTGALTDEIALTILAFCQADRGVPEMPIVKGEFQLFIDSVATNLHRFASSGERAIKISEKTNVMELLRKTRPGKREEDFWMAYEAEWLARALYARASEREIWERGLEKARNRAWEPDRPKKTPIESFHDRRRHITQVSATPPNRNY